jgi:hypothetical protein
VEYYLYGIEKSLQALVKIDNGFYVYDENLDVFHTDFYDDYFSDFTNDWRQKRDSVKAISYDEAMDFVRKRRMRKDKKYATAVKDLKYLTGYFKGINQMLKAMSYAWASLKCLWKSIDDEEGFITGAIDSYLSDYKCFFLPPSKIEMSDEKEKSLPSYPFTVKYAEKDLILNEGNVIYKGELLKDGFDVVMKISRHVVVKDKYDGVLRTYPKSVVGYWSLILE